MTEDLCLQIYLDSWLISQRAKTQCCSRESLLPVVRRGESNRFLNWVGQEPQAMSYTPRSAKRYQQQASGLDEDYGKIAGCARSEIRAGVGDAPLWSLAQRMVSHASEQRHVEFHARSLHLVRDQIQGVFCARQAREPSTVCRFSVIDKIMLRNTHPEAGFLVSAPQMHLLT